MSDGAAPQRSGWWPDPAGRFGQRYAIRGEWTSRVRVGDAEAIDGRPVDARAAGSPGGVERTVATADGAGWRDDPTGRFDQRWWDGQRWSRQIRHADAVATDATAAPPVRGRRRRRTAPQDADQPPPPGWIPDPDGEGQRFWNGYDWTAKRRTAPPPSRRLGGGWNWWSRPTLAAIAVLLLVTVALVVAALTAVWPPGS